MFTGLVLDQDDMASLIFSNGRLSPVDLNCVRGEGVQAVALHLPGECVCITDGSCTFRDDEDGADGSIFAITMGERQTPSHALCVGAGAEGGVLVSNTVKKQCVSPRGGLSLPTGYRFSTARH